MNLLLTEEIEIFKDICSDKRNINIHTLEQITVASKD